ncbi:hypothetical protein BN2476_590090 [Paraburkholderia piptadeniae]|uniref:Uncharacterized protein n=1 Tax=Paraburkholderia piptadeniae TaxID=1701573 RepID=A0A1N7SJU6_9BURK|nr:hypothetical protein BN2476_590090 [Paraburkholderia piptadeniae]
MGRPPPHASGVTSVNATIPSIFDVQGCKTFHFSLSAAARTLVRSHGNNLETRPSDRNAKSNGPTWYEFDCAHPLQRLYSLVFGLRLRLGVLCLCATL